MTSPSPAPVPCSGPPAGVPPGADLQCLTFTSAGTFFGVEISGIKEIIQYTSVTEVPMTPAQIRGVINLRGQVVPVVDLSVRFGHARSAIGRRSCVVILELVEGSERHDIGVLVDSVSEVVEIPAGDIAPAPSFGTAVRADFIRGMGRVDGGFVILLEVAATFDFRALADLAAATAEAN